MKLTTRRAAQLLTLAVLATGVTLLWSLYHASRQIPPFYRQALKLHPAAQKQAGQEFERSLLALHNQAFRPGQWTVRFTEQEINGWLASELPAKFPQALPDGVSRPLVSIQPRELRLALHYVQGRIDTVVSLAAEIYLTSEPNEVAVRLLRLRAGTLPVPIAQLQADIAKRALDAGFPLRWSETDGDPVALIKLSPGIDGSRGQRIVVEAIDLLEGELAITGTTEEIPGQAVATQPSQSETHER